ncbi:hypothetical protein HPB48_008437 [Haemaphysalis longicornis]|uniref:SWIM-type domain-containing protein n=1 Tax=Haemaphysalis longicornis TaxID=44386 RepID=A0A9J6GQT5_HAELO|nr:hypothetical protein HPB48_008437 [Haemaphysalis longicornis]
MDSLGQHSDIQVSAETCSCTLAKATMLPCRHLFFYRKEQGLPMFFDNGTPTRWTKSFYRQSCRLFATDIPTTGQANVMPHVSTKKVISECQKNRQATAVLLQIATLVAELPMRQYQQKSDLLQHLKRSLEERKEVILVEVANYEDSGDESVYDKDSAGERILFFACMPHLNITCVLYVKARIFDVKTNCKFLLQDRLLAEQPQDPTRV